MSRRLAVEALFANLIALFMLLLVLGGCSLQQNPAERPDWSLIGSDRQAQSLTASTGKHYADWNGPGAPKPLMYDSAQ